MEKKDSILSVLTDKQRSFLEENFRKLREAELFQKLSEIGPAVDQAVFGAILVAFAEKMKANVLKQEVSEEELTLTNGGLCGVNGLPCPSNADENCTTLHRRHIYQGKFPNCAATVEDGSWCSSNDACYFDEVDYKDMKSCKKAWK